MLVIVFLFIETFRSLTFGCISRCHRILIPSEYYPSSIRTFYVIMGPYSNLRTRPGVSNSIKKTMISVPRQHRRSWPKLRSEAEQLYDIAQRPARHGPATPFSPHRRRTTGPGLAHKKENMQSRSHWHRLMYSLFKARTIHRFEVGIPDFFPGFLFL